MGEKGRQGGEGGGEVVGMSEKESMEGRREGGREGGREDSDTIFVAPIIQGQEFGSYDTHHVSMTLPG